MKSNLLIICLMVVAFIIEVPETYKLLEYIFYGLSVPALLIYAIKS